MAAAAGFAEGAGGGGVGGTEGAAEAEGAGGAAHAGLTEGMRRSRCQVDLPAGGSAWAALGGLAFGVW